MTAEKLIMSQAAIALGKAYGILKKIDADRHKYRGKKQQREYAG